MTVPVTNQSIRDRRTSAGLTQEQLARKARCSAHMVRLLEGGWRPKSSPTLSRIEAVLDKHVDNSVTAKK